MVSVGVSDYPGVNNDLRLPSADARAFAQVYRESSGATVKLLTNSDATRENILKELHNLFAKAKKDDVVIFFFSGHGNKGVFFAYDTPISYQDIKKVFSACKSRNKMIFADACHSGNFRTDSGGQPRDSQSDVMLFLSCRDNETSFESSKMKNGFFTLCLTRCLKGAGDSNHDRVVTARELYTSVRKGVIRLSGDEQHPVMWGNFRDDMKVINWK